MASPFNEDWMEKRKKHCHCQIKALSRSCSQHCPSHTAQAELPEAPDFASLPGLLCPALVLQSLRSSSPPLHFCSWCLPLSTSISTDSTRVATRTGCRSVVPALKMLRQEIHLSPGAEAQPEQHERASVPCPCAQRETGLQVSMSSSRFPHGCTLADSHWIS